MLTGKTLGPYLVLEKLGEGGMGEVYRARDTKLNREVALKALPPSFAHDPERVARFRREAQLLASINHPHIAAIYGLEEVEGRQFLVLELVEGGTLADRIRKGALPFSEILAIARQLAEALEAAHERGIIHRDLKPANIALTSDDRVKVLDFGLAKASGGEVSSSDAGDSPTLTIGATRAGVILGTAAYMSPEQAKGRAADQRSDVWAFGCVLYEMLTGRRAFEGEDASDTLAAVLRADPDWSLVPDEVSDAIRVLLKRCLVKDRHARVANMGVARFVMSEVTTARAETHVSAAPAATPSRSGSRWKLGVTALAGVLAGGALGIAFLSFGSNDAAPPLRTPVTRFSVVPPSAYVLNIGVQPDRVLAISPDGTQLAYRGSNPQGQTMLFLRNLNELESRPLAGTEGGRLPFFSPDSRSIGYFTFDALMRVSASGGAPITICRFGFSLAPVGASWGEDDTIVFARRQRGIQPGTVGLQRVAAAGGEPTALTLPDVKNGDLAHSTPEWVGSDAVLFTSGKLDDKMTIELYDLKTSQRKALLEGGTNPIYVAPDRIVFVSQTGSLQVVRFDRVRREVVGAPVPLADQVASPATGEPQVTLSRNGTLAFMPAGEAARSTEMRSLVWVDRQGREEAIPLPPHAYGIARLSPDGTRLAVDARDQRSDIWIWDFARESLARLTTDQTLDMMPIWTPDNRRIIWTSNRDSSNPNLVWQAADGTGRAERLSEVATGVQFPTSVTPDGTRLVFFDAPRQLIVDMHQLALVGEHTRTPLLEGAGQKANGEVSPDGRWLAYESSESGQYEVYVRPFPNIDGGRWQISSNGGTRAAWSRNGAELFFLDARDRLTSVAVKTSGDVFVAGAPANVLERAYYPGFSTRGFNLRGYDVAADGRRFLMLKDPEVGSDPAKGAPTITVVVNWLEELNARLTAVP